MADRKARQGDLLLGQQEVDHCVKHSCMGCEMATNEQKLATVFCLRIESE